MRIVLDTNVLVSALLTQGTPPQLLHQAWEQDRFALATSEWQLLELSRTLSKPKLQRYIDRQDATLLIMELYDQAEIVHELPKTDLSPDPDDNHILAIALGGEVDCLVTGDKRDLLALKAVRGIPILTPRLALQLLLTTPS